MLTPPSPTTKETQSNEMIISDFKDDIKHEVWLCHMTLFIYLYADLELLFHSSSLNIFYIALNRVRNSIIHNQYQQVHCPSIHYQNEHNTNII